MKNEQSIGESEIAELHDTFVMFGSPEAPYWFLGLEEGDKHDTNKSVDSFVETLLEKTRRYRNQGVVSLRELCPTAHGRFLPLTEPGEERNLDGVKYQRTWGGYIKLLLSTELAGSNKSWSVSDVTYFPHKSEHTFRHFHS